MKTISKILVVLFLMTSAAFAQDAAVSYKVKITILGSVFKRDVDVVSNNLSRMPQMSGFAPTLVSRKNVQFTGVYTGDLENLVSDIENLAADRFTVKAKDNHGEFDITLRKVEPNMPFTPTE
jgi:hypothetical protein